MEVLLECHLLVLQDPHAETMGIGLQHANLDLMHVEEVLGKLVVLVLPVSYDAVETAHVGAVIGQWLNGSTVTMRISRSR